MDNENETVLRSGQFHEPAGIAYTNDEFVNDCAIWEIAIQDAPNRYVRGRHQINYIKFLLGKVHAELDRFSYNVRFLPNRNLIEWNDYTAINNILANVSHTIGLYAPIRVSDLTNDYVEPYQPNIQNI